MENKKRFDWVPLLVGIVVGIMLPWPWWIVAIVIYATIYTIWEENTNKPGPTQPA